MKLFPYLRSALCESKGVDSSIRLQMFLVCLVTLLVVLVWLGLSIYVTVTTDKKGLLEIPATVIGTLTSLLGIATGAKVYQYGKEPTFTP